MALNLMNLDERTRQLMLDEIDRDVAAGTLYMGANLTQRGQKDYEELLRYAVKEGDDATLARALRSSGRIAERTTAGRKVASNAAEVLAEGEFNRFYIRALCLRAIEDESGPLTVYRAKQVHKPRSESQALIGNTYDPATLLADIRDSIGTGTMSGVPGGPNSGLSVCL